MSDTCETVTIETKNGDAVINKSDFDKTRHTLSRPKAEKKEPKKDTKKSK